MLLYRLRRMSGCVRIDMLVGKAHGGSVQDGGVELDRIVFPLTALIYKSRIPRFTWLTHVVESSCAIQYVTCWMTSD